MHKITEHISDIVVGLLIFSVLVGAIMAATKTTVPAFFSNTITQMDNTATGIIQDATGQIEDEPESSEP